MELPVNHDNAQWWKAVVNCDERFDRVFLYGVTTTHVFCRPSCKSKTPLRKHVVFFSSAGEAETAGFRPCKRCRPDLLDERVASELVSKARSMMDVNASNGSLLSPITNELEISRELLTRLFLQFYNESPESCLHRCRIEATMAKIRGKLQELEEERLPGIPKKSPKNNADFDR